MSESLKYLASPEPDFDLWFSPDDIRLGARAFDRLFHEMLSSARAELEGGTSQQEVCAERLWGTDEAVSLQGAGQAALLTTRETGLQGDAAAVFACLALVAAASPKKIFKPSVPASLGKYFDECCAGMINHPTVLMASKAVFAPRGEKGAGTARGAGSAFMEAVAQQLEKHLPKSQHIIYEVDARFGIISLPFAVSLWCEDALHAQGARAAPFVRCAIKRCSPVAALTGAMNDFEKEGKLIDNSYWLFAPLMQADRIPINAARSNKPEQAWVHTLLDGMLQDASGGVMEEQGLQARKQMLRHSHFPTWQWIKETAGMLARKSGIRVAGQVWHGLAEKFKNVYWQSLPVSQEVRASEMVPVINDALFSAFRYGKMERFPHMQQCAQIFLSHLCNLQMRRNAMVDFCGVDDLFRQLSPADAAHLQLKNELRLRRLMQRDVFQRKKTGDAPSFANLSHWGQSIWSSQASDYPEPQMMINKFAPAISQHMQAHLLALGKDVAGYEDQAAEAWVSVIARSSSWVQQPENESSKLSSGMNASREFFIRAVASHLDDDALNLLGKRAVQGRNTEEEIIIRSVENEINHRKAARVLREFQAMQNSEIAGKSQDEKITNIANSAIAPVKRQAVGRKASNRRI